MIFIIGGFAQGKLDFAKKLINASDDFADGEHCNIENAFDKKIICNLHILIKRLMNLNIEPVAFVQENMESLKDKIIISDEIGLGVVPVDKFERNWREVTGRICCSIAKEADEVYRLYAGVSTKIKGQL